ncbi:MAG: hypothetical protein M3Z14_07765 [Candidatus Eremiobacteraeota bacterium]|nr:hypothetical protein [Candidatus Eremiobacteraeota bacterium]
MDQKFDVTLVTCDAFPNLMTDDQLLREALEDRGLDVRAAIWSDETVNWALSRLTVLRSTWDYHFRIEEFKRWLDSVETQTEVTNPAPIVRWNMHKGYLEDLARRDVPIAPTIFLRQGSAVDVRALGDVRGWHEIVIKPCVSGSAYHAQRFLGDAMAVDGAAHLAMLLRMQDVMVQPYMPAVETSGERALVFIGGTFSHAALKAPFSSGLSAGKLTAPKYYPTEEEVAFATRVVATLDVVPAYARVDFVVTESGPVVMELELIEPALYFSFEPKAAGRLADVFMARESTLSRSSGTAVEAPAS